MDEHKIDYLRYPIILVNPGAEIISQQACLKNNFSFYVVADEQECLPILNEQNNIAAIVCEHLEDKVEFWRNLARSFSKVRIFSLISPDQSNTFELLDQEDSFYHLLIKSSPLKIMVQSFTEAINHLILKRERNLLFTIQNQEKWFSLIGQLTREWSHEIRNYIAIISLNAEISIARIRKSSPSKPLDPSAMEKIIEQCLKISGVLDGVRELSKAYQYGAPSFPVTEIIQQAVSMAKLECESLDNMIEIKSLMPEDLCISQTEGTWLRSAIIDILRYYTLDHQQVPISILIEKEEEGFGLKIRLENIYSHIIHFGTEDIDSAIYKIAHIEPKKRDFYIGVRLLKSLGAEISLEKNELEKTVTLLISIPINSI